ncbi:MAG: 50S ribosomal protein L24 [candidate division Zixibacteria bacterium]|nr:50S ribosomal protein L24 [candidate division Zixibacteria bacterium]
MRVKKGDTVLVISGDDRGKMGKVLMILEDKKRVIVEGVNFIKRHTRPSSKNPKGGVLEKEGSIALSNIMIYCPKCSSPTKVNYKILKGGGREGSSKVRICKKCGEVL